MDNNYTAIILAAGKGTRLRPLTNDKPKCMVPIDGKPILERQIEVLNKSGIEDIVVVTCYLNEKISDSRIAKVHNREYDTTNMVYSLMCAREYLRGKVIVSYGDIVYSQNVLQQLMKDDQEMVVASDEKWLPYWKKRFDDPLSDAETFKKGGGGSVLSLGQFPASTNDIEGQFIGLMKFSKDGCKKMKQAYDRCKSSGAVENAWGSGRELTNTYMTDILNHFARRNLLHYIPIERGWFEVDNATDLRIANKEIDNEFTEIIN